MLLRFYLVHAATHPALPELVDAEEPSPLSWPPTYNPFHAPLSIYSTFVTG
jgi:hypothetical protein